MEIRRAWMRQLAATALVVLACGAVGTVIAAASGDTPAPVALAGR